MTMSFATHPALDAFVAHIPDHLVVAQVFIRRTQRGFELRHVDDRERAEETLRKLGPGDLRALAQLTAGGAFRPLKSAPSLRSGWVASVAGDAELELAVNQLYPGAVADWFASQSPQPPVTHYREFAGRQTGMYRLTTMLSDPQAAQVTHACCHKSFCLKRRIWTVTGVAPDAVEEKSLVPCLEPCALLLELARKAMRIEQEEKMKLELSPSEAATLAAALRIAASHPDPAAREADFDSPTNPRRVQLLREKLAPLPIEVTVGTEHQRSD